MPRMLFLMLTLAGVAGAQEPPVKLDLWPGSPPGSIAAKGEEADLTKPTENKVAGKRLIRLGNVSRPTLTVYRPAKPNGACVVVCPGGAYNILAMDLEGTEVCEWLNRQGITACLLKYRVPRAREGAFYCPAQQDAQRAMRLVRSRAAEWKLDPKKIGILGFSAGGHLATLTSTQWDSRVYDPQDDADKVSSRPDFTILVYPAYLVNDSKDKLAPEIKVSRDTPAMFLVHAADDPVPAESSLVLYQALRKNGVSAELHIYPTGGHGYGLRKTDKPVTHWTDRCEEWLGQMGLRSSKRDESR
ncbi:MAG: alpha/beta hydrolase [Gemmataceae bacterium]